MKLPKHEEQCYYKQNGHDLWHMCDCKAKFLGEPFSHWQKRAQEWVIETLLTAASSQDGPHLSIIGVLYQEHLLKLANAESKEMVKQVLEVRKTMKGNFNSLMNEILG